jgi:hypothetical protein
MSLTFIRTADQLGVKSSVTAYYASAERPGPIDVAAEAERLLKVWENGFEPAPAVPLKLLISPPSDGWIAIAFPFDMTFDLPLTAWLASQLRTETVAAFTWGDGYGLVAFDGSGVTYGEGHIRDERSDMHLGQVLKRWGVPFDGDEDRPPSLDQDDPRHAGWLEVTVPPRSWPPLPSRGLEDCF